jgi:hypothetical protein
MNIPEKQKQVEDTMQELVKVMIELDSKHPMYEQVYEECQISLIKLSVFLKLFKDLSRDSDKTRRGLRVVK